MALVVTQALAVKVDCLLVLAALAVLGLEAEVAAVMFRHQAVFLLLASAPALAVALAFTVKAPTGRLGRLLWGAGAAKAALAAQTEVVSAIVMALVAGLTAVAICSGVIKHLAPMEIERVKEPFVSYGVSAALVEPPHSHQQMSALNFLEIT